MDPVVYYLESWGSLWSVDWTHWVPSHSTGGEIKLNNNLLIYWKEEGIISLLVSARVPTYLIEELVDLKLFCYNLISTISSEVQVDYIWHHISQWYKDLPKTVYLPTYVNFAASLKHTEVILIWEHFNKSIFSSHSWVLKRMYF